MKSRWIVIYIVDDNLNCGVTFQGGAPIVTRLKDLMDKAVVKKYLYNKHYKGQLKVLMH